jgi:hypothetical protein
MNFGFVVNFAKWIKFASTEGLEISWVQGKPEFAARASIFIEAL